MSTPVVTGARAQACCGEGGGSGAPACDYEPYCVNADPSELDATILGLTPYAYYPLDDAAGLPQDVSGNGRHATAVVANVTYQQPALSTKGGQSILCTTGFFKIPQPGARLSDSAHNFTLAALLKLVDESGGHPPVAGPAGMYALIAQDASGNSQYDLFWDGITGGGYGAVNALIDLIDNQGHPKSCIIGPVVLGQPVAFIMRAIGTRIEYWVNGVIVGMSYRSTTAITEDVGIGGSPEATRFWATMQTAWSNLATWNRAISRAEVDTVTEAMVDDSILAAAWTPA